MAAAGAIREHRIELRVTREEKRLIFAAAAYQRLDVTSFIMRNILPVACNVVERAEQIVLSESNTARVLKLLENPQKPTPALMAAARGRAARKQTQWIGGRANPPPARPQPLRLRCRCLSTGVGTGARIGVEEGL